MHRLTLRTRLALLVLAGVVPFVLVNLGSAYLGYRDARERTARLALDRAHSLARAVEAELTARIAVLEVLAISRSLAAGDLAAFRAEAEAVLARQAPGANILLLRPDGRQLMNTALPPDAPLPVRRNLDNQRRVLATGQPSVSDVYLGRVVQRPVIAIEVPVRHPGGDLVLAMNPAPDAFDALIGRELLGPGWVIAVLDGAGVRVARMPEPDRHRAQPVTAGFMDVWRSGGPGGVIELATSDGVPALIAFSRLAANGWGTAVAVPLAEITAPAWRAAGLTLGVGLLLLLACLALARWISLGVMRPILELLRLAPAADGEPTRLHRGLGLPEADQLAGAFLEASRRRRAATAALVDSERRLRLVVAELNHRAKNALATVQALALQTARGEAGADPARFTEAFTGRLQTLARAHDLLAALSWQGAALGAVVRAGLAPWLEADAGAEQPRFRLRCPCTLALPLAAPGQVQALVMALHELATNATKYGALSMPEGQVDITCGADPTTGAATLVWREVGGPRLAGRPERRGFGTRLLEQAVARDLGPGAQVTLEFGACGLQAAIRLAPRATRPPLPEPELQGIAP